MNLATGPAKPVEANRATDGLSVIDLIGELRADNRKMREEIAAMRQELDAAKEAQGVTLDHGHVNHFADKWFHHDRPETAPVEAATPRFDPFTGERLVSQRQAEARQLYS